MSRVISTALPTRGVSVAAFVELLKPITWFPPMWAYLCGMVAAGLPLAGRWQLAVVGVAVAGPLVCGTSQAVNDWFDRHVDAINEPQRPIPSGRLPGRSALVIAIAWTLLSFAVAVTLGAWVAGAAALGLALAWAYSAPPLRLKQNGWWGNAAVGLCYEGLPWFTAVAALSGALPGRESLTLALLYSVGAHGIMTLNDFKSIAGDRLMAVRTLPVQLGARGAARTACLFMALPQLVVVLLLLYWQQPRHAAVVALLLGAQLLLMRRFLAAPVARATWYSAVGVLLYVLGMLSAALAVRAIVGPVGPPAGMVMS